MKLKHPSEGGGWTRIEDTKPELFADVLHIQMKSSGVGVGNPRTLISLFCLVTFLGSFADPWSVFLFVTDAELHWIRLNCSILTDGGDRKKQQLEQRAGELSGGSSGSSEGFKYLISFTSLLDDPSQRLQTRRVS